MPLTGPAGVGKYEQLILCRCAPSLGFVDLSIINGRIVVDGGRLMTGHLEDIVTKANGASARLCSYYTPEAVGG